MSAMCVPPPLGEGVVELCLDGMNPGVAAERQGVRRADLDQCGWGTKSYR